MFIFGNIPEALYDNVVEFITPHLPCGLSDEKRVRFMHKLLTIIDQGIGEICKDLSRRADDQLAAQVRQLLIHHLWNIRRIESEQRSYTFRQLTRQVGCPDLKPRQARRR